MNLTVTGANKSFPIFKGLLRNLHGKINAVRDVSLSVPEGKSMGIVGESGSGKTTLAKMIAGFIRPDSGAFHLGDTDLLTLSHKDRARMVQMVFQDPFASLNPKLVLRTQLHESLRLRGTNNLVSRLEDRLRDVGLSPELLNRYPHQLSGGQRQRFALARALAAEPRLLLADEPVSSLDLSVQAQIINLINTLRERNRLTLVVISHDLAVIANMCDEISVMKDGESVESGSTQTVIGAPQHPYTQRLLSATPLV